MVNPVGLIESRDSGVQCGAADRGGLEQLAVTDRQVLVPDNAGQSFQPLHVGLSQG